MSPDLNASSAKAIGSCVLRPALSVMDRIIFHKWSDVSLDWYNGRCELVVDETFLEFLWPVLQAKLIRQSPSQAFLLSDIGEDAVVKLIEFYILK